RHTLFPYTTLFRSTVIDLHATGTGGRSNGLPVTDHESTTSPRGRSGRSGAAGAARSVAGTGRGWRPARLPVSPGAGRPVPGPARPWPAGHRRAGLPDDP